MPRRPLWLRSQALQLGWPGAIGAGLLALGLGAFLSLVQPAQERVDAARRSVGSLQLRLAAAAGASQDLEKPVSEQLAAFYGTFPAEADAADTIGKIAAVARQHGLVLQQAEYRAERDRMGKLTRLRMSLPLKGPYPTIRQFLAGLRLELPGVALEEVHFERQKVGDPLIDAKVGLIIFLGSAS